MAKKAQKEERAVLYVRVDPELLARVESEAERAHKTAAELVREILWARYEAA